MRERIISHMNRDHQVALRDILAYYGGITLGLNNGQQGIELVDVQLDKLTLNYNDKGKLKSTAVALFPAMQNLSEARSRFIFMAHKAAAAMHYSPHRITKFHLPRVAQRAILAALLGLVGVLVGAVVNDKLAAKVKSITGLGRRRLKVTLYTTFLIHIAEVKFNLWPLLRFHRVSTRLRLLYIAATLLVGFPAWTPLLEEMKRVKRESKDVLTE